MNAKNIFYAISVFFIMAHAANAMPPADYKIIWQDEFKDASLNVNYWKAERYKRGAAQLTSDAVSMDKNGLRIRTYTENGINYTGFLRSDGLFLTTYGYFESRIRFRSAPGQHCAFWLQSPTIGKNIGDPAHSGTEIDIMEHRITDGDHNNKDIRNLALFTLHWDGYGPYHKQHGFGWRSASSLNNGWHTYAVLWTPGKYVFYVDDVERWRTDTAVSHVPQDVRLTCEVVGKHSWSGDVPAKGYGTKEKSLYGMDVKWVRVWQQQPVQ